MRLSKPYEEMRDFMLDYVNLFLDAINKYNEDDVDSKNQFKGFGVHYF